MNDYESRKQDRIDRLRAQAAKARSESAALRARSDAVYDAIPFGQPILVGHHSERADRNRRDRAFEQWGKSIAAAEKAEYYDQKAEAAENNTAISSDDPEALTKLRDRLTELTEAQALMKQANAHWRKHGTMKGWADLSDEAAARADEKIKGGYSWCQVPYPAYALQNNNANIRRIRERIAGLEQSRELGYQGWEFDGGEVIANSELNRLQIKFDAIPSEEQRTALKRSGFHWSRANGVWQRQMTDNAVYAAGRLEFLRPLSGESPVRIQPKARDRNAPGR